MKEDSVNFLVLSVKIEMDLLPPGHRYKDETIARLRHQLSVDVARALHIECVEVDLVFTEHGFPRSNDNALTH